MHSELQTYEDLNQSVEERIRQLNEELEQEKLAESEQNQKVETMKLEFSGMNQKISFITENINRTDAVIAALNEELNGLTEAESNSGSDVAQKEKEIDEIRKSIESAERSREELEQEIEAFHRQKEEYAKNHKEFFNKREELSEKMGQLDKDIYRLNSQHDKLEESRENQIDYMWNEYELTYGAAKELRNEAYDNPSQIKNRIQELKGQIRGLGDVNVNAIEEYKSVSERYEFLKNQHNDLIAAEQSLMQIIDELDKGMRAQFTEKFAEIRQEFDHVFKELFGGGKGTIELNEEEDILEAGITIISQPPGKKLQNMMQLSGGEKALTAIALLFAIQNLKPSPFCLLDEIEAALDDSNVSRYANYLHKLTKYTQFIVITHRKGTMEAADRLYGITMQEKGISTLVSVDLLDSQLTN